MEKMNDLSDEVIQRIGLGADGSLLALFGYDELSEHTQGINELRKHVLRAGFYTAEQVETESMICVADHEKEIYPAFQFDVDSKQPIPIVQEVNQLLTSDDIRPWEAAIWWAAANSYLDGISPIEAMGTEFEQHILVAAQEEVTSAF